MTKKKLGLVFFPAFDWMISPSHPERQERLLYTRDQLEEEGIFDCEEVQEYRPRCAIVNDLQRVHIGIPDISRVIKPAHLISAGGCLTASDIVMQGKVKKAFALVRPPGHHAMRVVHGIRGFCTINIEAIMVEYLRSKYNIKKIAVVDTDVHHGDGSQDIFYHDPNTLYISFHQDGRTLYPGTGFTNEAGSPRAWGTNINLPLLPGTGDDGLHMLYDELIEPIIADFQPELIINSAGQDNHFSDPLASMQITAQGYAKLTEKLNADIAVLEGGYSIEDALPYVNTGIILAMAGMDYSRVVEPNLGVLKRQNINCYRRIEKLIKEVKDIYFQREVMQRRLLAEYQDKWQQTKHIYYDEDGINEKQIETVYYCQTHQCNGYFSIQTVAQGGKISYQDAFIICLNRNICTSCRKKAYDEALYQKKTQQWQYVFVQDIASGLIEKI